MAYKMVGYFENWAQYRPDGQGKFLPEQIDPNLFTHINFAFGLFGFVTWSVDPTATRTGPQRYTGDYTIQPVEWNDNIESWGTPPRPGLYQSLQALKAKNPNLKTLLSIGGWSINSADDMPTPGNPHPYGPYTYQLFSKMAADSQGRTQFITSAIAYAQKYGFDGVDIDWEYPGYIGRGGTPDDLANFLALVQEFRATAGPGFLLTMAAPAIVPTGLPQAYHDNPSTYFQWLQQCSQSFDWLNVMSYDYHGAFDDPVKVGTGVNSPLTQDSTPNGPFSVKQTVETYLAAGIPADKIVLGMPTYGHGYIVSNPGALASNSSYGQPFSGPSPAGPATQTPGVLSYYEILDRLSQGDLRRGRDANTQTPYAYSPQTGEWVSYDDIISLSLKVGYAIEQGLGGAMVWAIDDDDFQNGFPLVSQINTILAQPEFAPPIISNSLLTGPISGGSADAVLRDWTWDRRLKTNGNPMGEVGTSGPPALAEFNNLLYCVHEGQGNSGYLWYTTFNGTSWSEDLELRASDGGYFGTSGPPALATYNGTLYCVHEGQGNSGYLWYTTFDRGFWIDDQLLRTRPGSVYDIVGTSGPPALAVYNGKLYCIHEGRDKESGYLWYTTFDGTTWDWDQLLTTEPFGYVGTSGPPALAVYNGKLYCIHEGQGNSGYLWYTTFDGTTWSKDQQLTTSGNGNVGTSGPPALVAYQDKLLCIHEGRQNAGYLWYTIFDGTTWSQDQQLPNYGQNYGTSRAPGLAVYQDTLYCIHEGRSNEGKLWYATHEPAVTVHVWTFTVQAWGHASLTLPDGTHISWWPTDNRTPAIPEQSIEDLDMKVRATLPANWTDLIKEGLLDELQASVYSAPAFPDQTFQDDMNDEAEDGGLPKPPDYQIPITRLDVSGIKAWWDTFRDDPNSLWKTFSQNCSTTVANALFAGNILFLSNPPTRAVEPI